MRRAEGWWGNASALSARRLAVVYAVVQSGGQQHKVKVGQILMVEKIAGAAEAGARVELDRVLAIGDDGGSTIGTPTVVGARVIAEVVDPDAKGKKLIVFKYKA